MQYAEVVVKVKHLRAILLDLQCRKVEPTYIDNVIVWVDNTACITLAAANSNDLTHETVKHSAVKVRFLQECVQHNSSGSYQYTLEGCRYVDWAVCSTSV